MNRLNRALAWVFGTIFIALSAIVTVETLARKIFNYSIQGADELGGYALLNLYANYTINRDWSAYARWNNVLDKDYRLASGYATPGSNLFVGVRYGFR